MHCFRNSGLKICYIEGKKKKEKKKGKKEKRILKMHIDILDRLFSVVCGFDLIFLFCIRGLSSFREYVFCETTMSMTPTNGADLDSFEKCVASNTLVTRRH